MTLLTFFLLQNAYGDFDPLPALKQLNPAIKQLNPAIGDLLEYYAGVKEITAYYSAT